MTAAGPWIRVDSGERPEDGRSVMVRSGRHFFCGVYRRELSLHGENLDDCIQAGANFYPVTNWDEWMDLFGLPEMGLRCPTVAESEARLDGLVSGIKAGNNRLATELRAILEFAEMRAGTVGDVVAVVRARLEEMSK